MLEFVRNLFDTTGFPPRWNCGSGWTQPLGWLHILSDWAIFGAYAAIPVVLAIFLRRRRDIPFPATGWLFVVFILSCGITHLVDSIMFYAPAYRALGVMKVVTALASWTTVVSLVQIMPVVLRVPGIQRQNVELRAGIEDRDREARSLERVRDQLETKAAEFTHQFVHLQSALEAALAFAVQWEAGSDRLLWQMGTERLFASMGIPVLTDWTQLLGTEGAGNLHKAVRDLRGTDAVLNEAFLIRGDPAGRSLRIIARPNPPAAGGILVITGMVRVVGAPAGHGQAGG